MDILAKIKGIKYNPLLCRELKLFNDIRYPHLRCRICNEFLKDYGGKKDQAHGFGPLLSDVWNDIHRIRHKRRTFTA